MRRCLLSERGLSLFECLLALSLLSTLFILCLQVNMQLVQHWRYLSFHYSAIRRQTSLIERYKSCQGHQTCQKQEHQQEQEHLKLNHPTSSIELTKRGAFMTSLVKDGPSREIISVTFDGT